MIGKYLALCGLLATAISCGQYHHLGDPNGASEPPVYQGMRPVPVGDNGVLFGVISDYQNQRIAGATVVVTGPSVQGTLTYITESDGEYHFANVPPGTYQLTVYYLEAETRRPNALVHSGRRALVNVRIRSDASSGEVIELAGRAPIIDQGSTRTGTTIKQDFWGMPDQPSSSGSTRRTNRHSANQQRTHRWSERDRTEKLKRLKEEKREKRGERAVDRKQLEVLLEGADEVWIIARSHAGTTASAAASAAAGQLMARPAGASKDVPMPLRHTDVHADILGHVASVQVQQSYHNPYSEKIEAVYVFPLPQNAAVSDFIMTIGKRKIRGIVRERSQAEEIYYQARQAGHTAAMMTQERPNIFTQRVANIEPNHNIDIDLTYFNTLPYRDGAYSFVFPTVVGPRFNPPGSRNGVGAVARGQHGHSGQATEVAYLAPGERTGHKVSLTVDLDAGVAVESIASENHAVQRVALGGDRQRITLEQGVDIADRDFVLRYKVAGEDIKSAFLVHKDKADSYFTMVLHPPADLSRLTRAPVEMVFVLDCSGSMSGVPLTKAKRAIRKVLGKMSARDTFQIIRFSSSASSLGPRPIPATGANIKRGLAYLDSLRSTGGTMMIEGIKAALDFPQEQGRLRLVSFMTDGYIGNESQILGAIHKKIGDARIFSFGVGSSVNRFLLERMAKLGRGAVAYVGLNDGASDQAVDAFYERISHPALTDVTVEFAGMNVSDVYPANIPDLFVGRPVVLTGRFSGTPQKSITVIGRANGERVSFDVPVSAARNHPALAKVWARTKIQELADRSTYTSDIRPLAAQIEKTAIRHGILSSFTAFVAVDSSRRTAGHRGTTVQVPVHVPAGVKYETTVQSQ